ncbi:hypothetical protein WJX81_003906 [Elliptochloris bilobata]|uniref:Uncharacterized protein n=1 Tax=Elliptochloris bilobata TaxID=381761 RepID=A0AAW1RGI4_9CHLO
MWRNWETFNRSSTVVNPAKLPSSGTGCCTMRRDQYGNEVEGSAGVCLRVWVSIVSLLQLGCAVAIVLITYFKLSHITNFGVNLGQRSYSSQGVCYLDTDTTNTHLCVYAYFVAGVSMLATILFSMLLCCTCNFCGCGEIFEFIFAGLGTAWWAVASVVLMQKSFVANNANIPMQDWRTVEWIVSWAACGLFGLLAILSLFRSFAMCCGRSKY